MHILVKFHAARSMFQGVENESNNNGLGGRKGPNNQWSLGATIRPKFMEKLMVLEAKVEENHEEGASKNYVVFACVLESIFEGFGENLEGFWQGFGTSLDVMGALSVFFFSGFVTKRAQETAKRCLGLHFEWIWDGLGRGLGGFWTSILMFFCFFCAYCSR